MFRIYIYPVLLSSTVYIGEEGDLDFRDIPDIYVTNAQYSPIDDPLGESLRLLRQQLEDGTAVVQFEQLYRKKPGMTMNVAGLPENIPKNRYPHIMPYDETRVLVNSGGHTPDYINANYINVTIPGSGLVNRYVAAQCPLPASCGDFWQMVWDEQSTLVIMLTTKVERNLVKCHQYWPDLYQTLHFGRVQVTCTKEDEEPSFTFREFMLVHVRTTESRHVHQMQYLAWPDYGVPDDNRDFLNFVNRVRENRKGMWEPTVVHCSAGIGRTGVLVTMETAMCLVEANQPVHPLDIVRQMRDQRAMLIQTTTQYKFVCEAILRAFDERIVRPLGNYL